MLTRLYAPGKPARAYSRFWASKSEKVVMFLFHEYLAFALLALLAAGLFVALCGTGYLLKVAGGMCRRTVQGWPYRTAILKSMVTRYRGRQVICTATEPGAVAD